MDELSHFLTLVATLTGAVFLVAWLIRGLWGRVKRRTVRAGAFFWALQSLGQVDVPPPTPQEQIEQENREKKNRGATDSSRS